MRSAGLEFACLFFDAEDCVCVADVVSAPIKAPAIESATALMDATPGVIGFQIWHCGLKVAEKFLPESERAARALLPRRRREMA